MASWEDGIWSGFGISRVSETLSLIHIEWDNPREGGKDSALKDFSHSFLFAFIPTGRTGELKSVLRPSIAEAPLIKEGWPRLLLCAFFVCLFLFLNQELIN